MTSINQPQVLELNKIAKQMVAPGKGILAADESTGTIGKRFDKISLPNEEVNRQAYREMLFTTPDIGKYISGAIMYDETIRQSAKGGQSFVSILQKAGVLPGIKVDLGTESFKESPEEKIVEMQKRKKGLVKKVVSCDDEAIAKLTWEDVLELLQT